MKAKIILLGLAICALMVCCDKEPDPEPDTSVPDYREKWAGVYDIVEAPSKSISLTIVEKTDSLMHYYNNHDISAGFANDVDLFVLQDGTFAYYGDYSDSYQVNGYFYAGDSLFVWVTRPGNLGGLYNSRFHCKKRK